MAPYNAVFVVWKPLLPMSVGLVQASIRDAVGVMARGTENHLHVLLSLPATMSLAQSDAIAKRRLLSLDERDTHARVRVAGRVRRFHRRDFAEE